MSKGHVDVDASIESHRVDCPECRGDLDIHQPDVELPDRLLMTCDRCKAWFIADGEGRIKTAIALERLTRPTPSGFPTTSQSVSRARARGQ